MTSRNMMTSPNVTFPTLQALCLEDIRSSVQDRTVLALLSGGVDSTVLAALLTKALGSC